MAFASETLYCHWVTATQHDVVWTVWNWNSAKFLFQCSSIKHVL